MRLALGCLIAAACLFASGCGGGSAPTAASGGAPAGPPAAPGGGPPAPPGAGGSGASGASSGAAPSGGEGTPSASPAPPGGDGGGGAVTVIPPGEGRGPADSGAGGGYGVRPTPDGGGPGAESIGGFGGAFRGGFGGGEGGNPGEGGGLPNLSAFQMPQLKPLRVQAIDAFRAGDETTGMQLLLTHFAVVPSAGKELGEKMTWIPGLRRPALGPRIALAVFYDKPPRDFEGSPMPIGSSELAAIIQQNAQQQGGNEGKGNRNKRNNPGAGEPGPALAGGAGGNGTESPGKTDLIFHTGDLGTKFLEALQLKFSSGDYGPMYKDISEEVARPALPDDPNNPGPGNPGLAGGEGGGFGRAGVLPGGQPAPGGEGGAAGVAQPLGLGVIWLGKATSKDDANRMAEQAQADILVTYEILVRVPPRGEVKFVNNTTTIRITPVKKGEPIFNSEKLNNYAVAQAQSKVRDPGKGEDTVEKEIKKAIEALDKVCTAGPLPAGVNAAAVKNRLATLVAERPANSLPVIVEARYYVAKGLLPEEEMQAAAIGLMGEAEYSRLIARSPDAGLGQMLGSALSLPGVMNMVRGANVVAGAAGGGRRRPAPAVGAAPGGEGQPAPRRGLRGLLPF